MADDVEGPKRTVWTIGHSNHALETLLAVIGGHRIAVVVDVRSQPYSRYASQFDREAINAALSSRGIEYLFLGDALGGRPKAPSFYDKLGHVRYDRLAQSPEFQHGIERLLGLDAGRPAAILCSEDDPVD